MTEFHFVFSYLNEGGLFILPDCDNSITQRRKMVIKEALTDRNQLCVFMQATPKFIFNTADSRKKYTYIYKTVLIQLTFTCQRGLFFTQFLPSYQSCHILPCWKQAHITFLAIFHRFQIRRKKRQTQKTENNIFEKICIK